jgi:membrane-bound lytic murein transglycosylase D
VRRFLDSLQQQLQGEYVIELAYLRQAAHTTLSLLEAHDETVPYALWLRTKMDLLEVAEELRLIIPPPRSATNSPAERNPPPETKRSVWIQKYAKRTAPERAQKYVDTLKPIFTAEGVAPELVWLAEVESSFDARARSPAGAAGLFQLMPATAAQYGLRTRPVDQRLNPEESARAAARHLRYLHGRFRDWRLALAAYNAGEGAVGRLLQRRRATTFEGIASYLPAETQLYVPKVEAVLLKREGVDMERLGPPAAPR